MKIFNIFKSRQAVAKVEQPQNILNVSHLPVEDQKFLQEYVDELNSQQQNAYNLATIISPNKLRDDSYVIKGLSLRAAVEEGFKANPIVYCCIEVIATNGSSVPLILRERKKNDNNQFQIIDDVKKYPILKLLERPSKQFSAKRFFHIGIQRLCCCGNFLVLKNRIGKQVKELMILNPDYLDIKHDGVEIEYYEGREHTPYFGKKYLAKDVIHWMLPDPGNPFWGVSPLQVAYLAIDTDRKIGEWWNNTLENGCKKDAVIKYKHALKKKEFLHARSLVEQQVKGFRSGRGFMILGNEAEIDFLDYSPADLDFVESRKQTKNLISSVFRVPPPIVGDHEFSSYNNMKEARQSFWLDTILPILNEIRDTLNYNLLEDFGMDPYEFMIDYDTSEVESLQRLFYEKIDAAVQLHGMGYPVNMVNRRMDLEMSDVEGGDIPYISANLVPLGDWSNGDLLNEESTSSSTVQSSGKEKTKPRSPNSIQDKKPSK